MSRTIPTLHRSEPTPAQDSARERDVALVRSVLDGSEEAWHVFIERYSALVMAVIRRYVSNRRDDEARTLFADVLESLYRRKLATYAGRSALSTWLVLVTRSAVVDHLRRELGGRDVRKALRDLDPFERRVFRHYHLEGLAFGTVLGLVAEQGVPVTPDRLLCALRRIEDRIHGRVARRLRYDLHAQSIEGASGRLLEYLDHVQSEFEEGNENLGADYYLLQREARRTTEAVLAMVTQLPPVERRLLSLRYQEGWSARRIAEELGMGDRRAVYTVIERILRTFRRVLGVQRRIVPTEPTVPDVTTAVPATALVEGGEPA